jgi:hypothetical membrane protein
MNADRQGVGAWRAGLFGAPVFVASLLIFGARTPGFSHRHKAVSELGGLGAPWGLWFDFFGLLIPGLLAVATASELRRRLRSRGARTRSVTLLWVFAGMFALTAVPADFGAMFKSPWTWAHAFFVLGNAPVLFAAIPGCARSLRELGASARTSRIFVILGYLPAAEFLLYGVLSNMPGLVQRLMIVTTHLAIAWLSWTLLRTSRTQ